MGGSERRLVREEETAAAAPAVAVAAGDGEGPDAGNLAAGVGAPCHCTTSWPKLPGGGGCIVRLVRCDALVCIMRDPLPTDDNDGDGDAAAAPEGRMALVRAAMAMARGAIMFVQLIVLFACV